MNSSISDLDLPNELSEFLSRVIYTQSTNFEVEYINGAFGASEDLFHERCSEIKEFVKKLWEKRKFVPAIKIWQSLMENLIWEFDCVIRIGNLSPDMDEVQSMEESLIGKSINLIVLSCYRKCLKQRTIQISIETNQYLRNFPKNFSNRTSTEKDQSSLPSIFVQKQGEIHWSKHRPVPADLNNSQSNDMSSFLRGARREFKNESSRYPEKTQPFGPNPIPLRSAPQSHGNPTGSIQTEVKELDKTRCSTICEDLLVFALEEIRPSLSQIIGNLELIKEEVKELFSDSLVTSLLRTTLSSSILIQSLVNDLNDFQELSNGSFRLTPDNFDLRQTVLECFDLVRIAAESKNTILDLEFLDEVPMIRSDKQRIMQVILNFLNHAIKTTTTNKEGFIKVFCSSSDSVYTMVVEDTGFGVSEEMVGQINLKNSGLNFTSFGEGISFYICKQILNKLGPIDTMVITNQKMISNKIRFDLYKNVENITRTTMITPSMISLDRAEEASRDKYKKFKSTQSILKLNDNEAKKSKLAIELNRRNKTNGFTSEVSHNLSYRPLNFSDKDNSSVASFQFLNKVPPEKVQEPASKPLYLLLVCQNGLPVEVLNSLFKSSAASIALPISVSVFNHKVDKDLERAKSTADVLILDEKLDPEIMSKIKASKLSITEKPLLVLWSAASRMKVEKSKEVYAVIDQFEDERACAKLLQNCRDVLASKS